MSELRQRVISGVVMAIIFLAGVFVGGWPFVFLITAIALIVWVEWVEIGVTHRDDRIKLVGALLILAFGVSASFLSGWWFVIAISAIASAGAGMMLSWTGGSAAIYGLIYAGGFLLSMALLRGHMDDNTGLIAILYLCVVVWFTDIGAYFAGRSIGGPKLAPSISPNKTISGAVGGMICAALGAIVIMRLAGIEVFGGMLLLALVLSAISQIGDLFESSLKRKSGVKDSGNFIPGHGGMMDRIDGLVFASISLWIAGALAGSLTAPAHALFR